MEKPGNQAVIRHFFRNNGIAVLESHENSTAVCYRIKRQFTANVIIPHKGRLTRYIETMIRVFGL